MEWKKPNISRKEKDFILIYWSVSSICIYSYCLHKKLYSILSILMKIYCHKIAWAFNRNKISPFSRTDFCVLHKFCINPWKCLRNIFFIFIILACFICFFVCFFVAIGIDDTTCMHEHFHHLLIFRFPFMNA